MMDIANVVLGVIASIGGIGFIFTVVVKFSSDIIAQRLEERYSLKINKELEKYKATIDNKTYISKTKFDTEFEIYKNLSRVFFDMVRDISIMIPILGKYPADEEAKKEYEEKLYNVAKTSCIKAQNELSQNIPFIPEAFYEQYDEIRKLCIMQLDAFERRWDAYAFVSQKEKESFSPEDYRRTTEINQKFKELNANIREYLSKLDVLG